MSIALPPHITTDAPSGWFYAVYLRCTACGWKNWQPLDPVCDESAFRRAAWGHTCEPLEDQCSESGKTPAATPTTT